MNQKPIEQQVIVITGASSGIGLTTAREAARRGAKVVLAARSEATLQEVVAEIQAEGGQAVHVDADVSNETDVKRIAQVAIEHFGGFDTWVNNAGISIYGRMEEVAVEDHRQLFETNFWGVVYGSLEAAKHLRARGGTLINIGSILSDRAIPIQGMYSASKHAVKGFTDALRMELEKDGAPIYVSLVKPSSTDTPFTEHAKNYMAKEPSVPPPVYAPDPVADAILYCAENPQRDLTVGSGGKMITALGARMPRLTDKLMEGTMFRLQKQRRPAYSYAAEGLHYASAEGHERSGNYNMVRERSLYTRAQMHPVRTALVGLGAAAIVSSALGMGLGGMLIFRGAKRASQTWRDYRDHTLQSEQEHTERQRGYRAPLRNVRDTPQYRRKTQGFLP